MSCVFKHECESVALEAERENELERREARRRVLVNRSPVARRTIPGARPSTSISSSVIEHDESVRGIDRMDVTELTLPKQVGVHAVWGAIEGALGMVLSFFQRRRPH
jgi:hypothetical protein